MLKQQQTRPRTGNIELFPGPPTGTTPKPTAESGASPLRRVLAPAESIKWMGRAPPRTYLRVGTRSAVPASPQLPGSVGTRSCSRWTRARRIRPPGSTAAPCSSPRAPGDSRSPHRRRRRERRPAHRRLLAGPRRRHAARGEGPRPEQVPRPSYRIARTRAVDQHRDHGRSTPRQEHDQSSFSSARTVAEHEASPPLCRESIPRKAHCGRSL